MRFVPHHILRILRVMVGYGDWRIKSTGCAPAKRVPFYIMQIMRAKGRSGRRTRFVCSHNPRHYVTWRGFAQTIRSYQAWRPQAGHGKRLARCMRRNTANAASDLRVDTIDPQIHWFEYLERAITYW
jgi:hypothetical protein